MSNEMMSIEELENILKNIQAEGPPIDPVAEKVVTAAIAHAHSQGATHLDLQEFVDAEQLKKDVEFNPTDLDNAVRHHASLFVFYADRARLARRQWERMKVTVEVLESRMNSLHREAMLAEGKKATEAAVEAAVKGDPRWFAAQQKLIDARAIFELASDAREAFNQRRDMIVQSSVDRRVERQGDIRILAAQEASGSVQNSRAAALATIAANARNTGT